MTHLDGGSGARVVSCAPAALYRDHVLPTEDLPGLLDPAHTAAAGITLVQEVFPKGYYKWPAAPEILLEPSAFGTDLLQRYGASTERHVPPSVLVEVADAVVAHNVVFGAGPDRSIVYESFRPNDRAAITLPDGLLEQAQSERFAHSDRPHLYLGSAGSFNYGHWLVDDLPRAAAWVDLVARGERRPVVVLPSYGPAIDAVRVQSLLALVDRTMEIDLVDPTIPHRFAHLLWVSPISSHPVMKSPAALEQVASWAHARLPEQTRGDRRLLVVRDPARGRSIVNLDELRARTDPYGFELIDCEQMSFQEQVSTFRQASVIVGQMGASMTNSLFCRPATTLLYLAPEDWVETFYWDLAITRGHHYLVQFGPSPDATPPPHLRDFSISVDRVVEQLELMGLSRSS